MDQSKALNQLLEAADLVGMIEDLTEPSRAEALSSSSQAGIRITLRNIRDTIVASHNTLAADLIAKARVSSGKSEVTRESVMAKRASASTPQMTRKDLKTALERVVD